MSFTFGNNIKITVFGQSHGEETGIVIDGLPKGITPDTDNIAKWLALRSPYFYETATARVEPDEVQFVSGLFQGKVSESPLVAVIKNKNAAPEDYPHFIPRPSHADYTAFLKYGSAFDYRGGGSFSGRMTAVLCIAGAICSQVLLKSGIATGFHISSVGNIKDKDFDAVNLDAATLYSVKDKSFPVLDDTVADKMKQAVKDIKNQGDSLGGVIECAATGVPSCLGEPMFNGLESTISALVFSIPAVKGIEFGSGFYGSTLKGSCNNDEFYVTADKKIKTKTNNHGGILGGISSGMPIVFKTAFKPTPSIAKTQNTVNIASLEEVMLQVKGRHDACIALRAGVCVEAALSIVLLDMLKELNKGEI